MPTRLYLRCHRVCEYFRPRVVLCAILAIATPELGDQNLIDVTLGMVCAV